MSASPVLHMNQNDLFNLITGHTVKKMRGKRREEKRREKKEGKKKREKKEGKK